MYGHTRRQPGSRVSSRNNATIVTAATTEIPPPLLAQLKPGAKLVIPLGQHAGYQELMVVEVDADGEETRRSVLPVRFVPLTGDAER